MTRKYGFQNLWKSLENRLTGYRKASFNFGPSSTVGQTLGYDLKIVCAKIQGNRFIIDGEIDEKHALTLQNYQNEYGPAQATLSPGQAQAQPRGQAQGRPIIYLC